MARLTRAMKSGDYFWSIGVGRRCRTYCFAASATGYHEFCRVEFLPSILREGSKYRYCRVIPGFADDSPRRHHIVAQNDHRAEQARQVPLQANIDFRHDPVNIATIPHGFHKSMRTKKYYIYVNEKLEPFDGTYDYAGIVATLMQRRYEILLAAEGGPVPWI